MELLGDNTRNIYKDNYDRNRFLDKTVDFYQDKNETEKKPLTNRELGNMLYNTIRCRRGINKEYYSYTNMVVCI